LNSTSTMLVSRTALSSLRTRPIANVGHLAFSTTTRRPLFAASSVLSSKNQFKGPRGPLKLSVRPVASSVAGRPGSSSIPHAAQNIKEEMGHTIEDIAQTIAGNQQPTQLGSTATDAKLETGFVGLTSTILSAVPTPVMVFGLAGALPYLGASGFTVYLANQAGQAASGEVSYINPALAQQLLDQAMSVQVTYGAVMLGFLGALHWGMEFAGYGGHKGSKRLLLGLAPTLVGWSTLALDPSLALVTQWAGFTGLWYADMKATSAGWTPLWYSQYRFYLSILVGTCIIGTLAGTSYLGPTQTHSATLRELNQVRKDRASREAEKREVPVSPGEVGGVSGVEENADAYVLIKHAPEKKEEKEKKEKK